MLQVAITIDLPSKSSETGTTLALVWVLMEDLLGVFIVNSFSKTSSSSLLHFH